MTCFKNWKEASKQLGQIKFDAIRNYQSLEAMWKMLGKAYWTADIMLDQVDEYISNFHNILFLVYDNLFEKTYNMDWEKLYKDYSRLPDITMEELNNLYEQFSFYKEIKEVEE